MTAGAEPQYLLRPNVQVAPVPEGLGFWGWTSSFVVKGPAALAALWQAALPRLQQGASRAELLAGLPGKTHPVLERILVELAGHDMLLDSSQFTAPPIEDKDAEPYLDTLRYLQSMSADPYAAFARIRSARVVALGVGPALWPAVRLLLQSGAGTVTACPWRDAALQPPPAEPTIQVRPQRTDDASHLAGLLAEAPHLIMQLEVDPATPRLAEVAGTGRAAGIPVVGAVVLHDRAVVGPIGGDDRPDSSEALAALRRRRGDGSAQPGADTSPVLAALAGNLAAFTALRLLAGLPTALTDGTALVLERERLHTSEHPVIITGPDRSDPAVAAATFRDAPAAVSRSEALKTLEPLADNYFGLLSAPGPGELTQIPLHLAAAELPPPHEPSQVVSAGLDGADARLRVLVEAMRRWVVSLEGTPERVAAATLAGAHPVSLSAGAAVMAAGHDYHGWLADGLLSLAAHGILAAGPSTETTFAELPQGRASWWAKCLSVRYGLRLRITLAEVDHLPAYTCTVYGDGEPLGVAAGVDGRSAIEEALLQAVGRVQARENGLRPELRHSATATEPVLGARREEPPPLTERASWVRQAVTSLGAAGHQPAVRPFLGQPRTYARGLLLGWVGLTDVE
jgi:hypothetical protein